MHHQWDSGSMEALYIFIGFFCLIISQERCTTNLDLFCYGYDHQHRALSLNRVGVWRPRWHSCSPNQTKTNLKLQRLDYVSLITEFDSQLPRYVFLFFIVQCQKCPDCTGIQRAIKVLKFPYERLTEWVVSQRFTSHIIKYEVNEGPWNRSGIVLLPDNASIRKRYFQTSLIRLRSSSGFNIL